ncbi:NUDIX domain-containing protein [uncultured Maribacter sp.]|uniref:NUDIX domain-containing protein n=1 Tax=uncultured Maribacter sp. TaxID=431308 RepID=UPI00262454A4|nr:NUDIX domain-containing protein [uncultured Maribacter sp.]
MKYGKVRNVIKDLLSDNWYTLSKFSFEYLREDGVWEKQEREVYDCGDAAAILLYNKQKQTVVLTKQFRMPVFQNETELELGNGMMVEVCAGLLDGDTPEVCIIKEAIEETGYKIDVVTKVFESFMVPGTVMQKVHFFVGEYKEENKISAGGGADYETENIEVLEVSLEEAISWVQNGKIKDGKTIMLLQHAQIQNLL